MAPLAAETPAFESTMENDVGTVKKSRAASPAPKTSKANEDKEVVKPSPSAEKVSKVEKSSETKTDKVEKTKIRVGIFAAVGIAALVAVLVALCFFMPTPLDLKLTSNYMIGGISLVAVALTAGTAVAVKKFKLKLPVACKKQS